MEGIITRIAFIWVLAGLIGTLGMLTGCGSVELYGGIRRSDTRVVTETTTAPKRGLSDAVYEWLFVNHEEKRA